MDEPNLIEIGDGQVFDRAKLVEVLDVILFQFDDSDRIVAGLSVTPEPDRSVTVCARLDSEDAPWTRIGTFDLDEIRVGKGGQGDDAK